MKKMIYLMDLIGQIDMGLWVEHVNNERQSFNYKFTLHKYT